MKKYKIITEVSPIQIEIDSKISERSWEETVKEIHYTPIDTFKQQTPLPCFIEESISEETFKVLENICNIEMNRYGEKTYICNNIRMKIERTDE